MDKIHLTKIENLVLATLAANRGKFVPIDTISAIVWPFYEDRMGLDKTLSVHIAKIRDKLDLVREPGSLYIWNAYHRNFPGFYLYGTEEEYEAARELLTGEARKKPHEQDRCQYCSAAITVDPQKRFAYCSEHRAPKYASLVYRRKRAEGIPSGTPRGFSYRRNAQS